MSIWECFVLVFIWQTFLTAYKVENKVTERKLVKMLLKTYFSRIQGYIYPHIVAVMSLYQMFVVHSLQCLSKTTTIFHQSISSVKVKVILGDKIVGPKMIFG